MFNNDLSLTKENTLKKLALIFNDVEEVHLGKDVFLTPYYIAKEFNLSLDIIFPNTKTNQNIPKTYRSATFKRLNLINSRYNFIKEFNFLKYLICNSKKIDYLMLFHLSNKTMRQALLYKRLNPNGKVYVKLDINTEIIDNFNSKKNSYKTRRNKKLMLNFYNKVDAISCETSDCHQKIMLDGIYNINIADKLTLIPNGVDDELLQKLELIPKTFTEKEKIMISVGRIGTEQKNNELLLEALNNIDLKDWKVFFIGPVTAPFKEKYSAFINQNPDKLNSVQLMGNVSDKDILYSYYNRAQIFILTSINEGFPLVFPEALYFGNYIISTDVGGAKDITKNGAIGKIYPINDLHSLRVEIAKIIQNKIDLEQKYAQSIELSRKQFLWSSIISKNSLLHKTFSA